jgi:hypothetical protein
VSILYEEIYLLAGIVTVGRRKLGVALKGKSEAFRVHEMEVEDRCTVVTAEVNVGKEVFEGMPCTGQVNHKTAMLEVCLIVDMAAGQVELAVLNDAHLHENRHSVADISLCILYLRAVGSYINCKIVFLVLIKLANNALSEIESNSGCTGDVGKHSLELGNAALFFNACACEKVSAFAGNQILYCRTKFNFIHVLFS